MKTIRRALFAILTAAALFGCARVETRPEVVQDVMRFEAVPDKAVLYVLRDFRGFQNMDLTTMVYTSPVSKPGSGEVMSVATMSPNSFARFVLPPGRYRLYANGMTMSLFDNPSPDPFEIAAGSVVFRVMAPVPSWSGTHLWFDPVERDEGVKRIKDKGLALVRNER